MYCNMKNNQLTFAYYNVFYINHKMLKICNCNIKNNQLTLNIMLLLMTKMYIFLLASVVHFVSDLNILVSYLIPQYFYTMIELHEIVIINKIRNEK